MTATKQFDATFVGLTILDISGRPVRGIPDGGGVEFIDEIKLCPAGTAAGALMNAAKLGIKCRAVACLGNDEKGDFILDSYRRIGNIDVAMVQRTDDAPTSATILPIRPNGDRPALHQKGASDYLWIKEDDFSVICDNTKILHHGGTGLLKKMDESGQSAKLLAYAKSKGVVTTLDLIAPNDSTIDLLREILPHVDYFMPSMEEALFLSQTSNADDAANFFLEEIMKGGTCIFKWGAKGSFLKSFAGERKIIPAYRINVKDTTGCGDSYCGGFVAGLIKYCNDDDNNGDITNQVLDAACRLGTATSALVATGLGSDAGVVDYESTKQFMENSKCYS